MIRYTDYIILRGPPQKVVQRVACVMERGAEAALWDEAERGERYLDWLEATGRNEGLRPA